MKNGRPSIQNPPYVPDARRYGSVVVWMLILSVAPMSWGADTEKTQQRSKTNASSRMITIRGVVFGPDDQPVAGAKLYVNARESRDSMELGTSTSDGTFRFDIPRQALTRTMTPTVSLLRRKASLLAIADGFGAAWALLSSENGGRFGEMKPEYEVALRLVNDLPIKGRVVDPAGKAVAGAVVAVERMHELRSDRWHKMPPAIQALDVDSMTRREIDVIGWSSGLYPAAWRSLLSSVTDEAGEFTLTGLGRQRAAVLRVSGPGVQGPRSSAVLVRDDAAEFTRLVRRKYPPQGRDDGVRMFGTDPTIVVERARTVAGTVRDAGTGKPVEGASVYILGVRGRARTDRHGRYRLVRSEDRSRITVVAYGDDEVSLPTTQTRTGVGETGEASVDFELPRGVWVRGKAVEAGTDRPIFADHRLGCHDIPPGPRIAGYASYYPLKDNQWVRDLGAGLASIPFESSQSNHLRRVTIDGNGEFQMAVPPGPGIILIESRPPLNDSQARVVPEVPYMTLRGNVTGTTPVGQPLGLKYSGLKKPIAIDRFHAYKLIDPAEEETSVDLRFEVKLPPKQAIRFVDPDGKPVAGLKVAGLVPKSTQGVLHVIRKAGAEATAYDIRADHPRKIVALSLDGRFGIVESVSTTHETPITVAMRPSATLKFRLINEATGEPLVGYQPWAVYDNASDPWFLMRPTSQEGLATNERGETTISAIVPGEPMSLFFTAPVRKSLDSLFGFERSPEIKAPTELTHLRLEAGEERDLGEVQARLSRQSELER